MRIVLFGPVWPFRGGVPHFAGALCGALRRAGHEVTLINFEKLFPKLLFPGKSQLDDSPHAVMLESQRVFCAWKPHTWRETAQAIEAARPDLIIAQWWMPTFGPGYRGVAKSLSPESRRKLVYVIHDVVSHERRPGDVWLAKRALRMASKFLVLSRSEGERLKMLLPDLTDSQVVFAPHPAFDQYKLFAGTRDEAKRKLGVSAKRVLLFFGFVRKYKGLDLLIEAMPEILQQEPDTELLICGPFHEPRERYETRMRELGVREKVVIQERYFSGDEVGECFAAADAVVLPYRSATQSGVIPAALALETPVIATRAGGLDAAVSGSIGVVMESAEPHDVAEAVKRFYETGGRAAFRNGLRTELKRQSWEEFVRTVEGMKDEDGAFVTPI